jgi:hypothetical protein
LTRRSAVSNLCAIGFDGTCVGVGVGGGGGVVDAITEVGGPVCFGFCVIAGLGGAGLSRGTIGSAAIVIFVSNSSRTVSFIIAPHVRQMDKVGARSRLQTGQIICVSG